ncbi:4'-phosphopantetheinyl transferase superfamily protein [Achromobacter sp. Marseille-Q0513]|uniref:4'-phosphopantetheinyl transferase family protein n=1 Tax=Achromobacter sp. Marseille-Q0513 TaxID=2829161 RepID=UPI001BA1973E|nr:4'-phosphopantetheinyl transferase superfamily protein [Achromobacter sp. Marseille-Q0513]MBR8653949.1 4'-phosphopantetheinyl transferase superfamily protein [Achromobacter sp. Marseille-Q0513]
MSDHTGAQPSAHGGALAWGATPAVLHALAAEDIPLTPDERARANAFAHDADRRDFIAAHRLVRALAASIIGVPPGTITLLQRCDTCGGPHGRPVLPDHPSLHISLSHAKGVVAAACGNKPVGIDMERWHLSHPDHSDLDYALAPAERQRLQSMAASDTETGAAITPAALAFLRLWVRKECLVKLGRITLDQLDSVDFSAFMQTESVAQTAVAHFEHQGLRYSEWLDPELRVVGTAVGDGPFDIHQFR